MSDADVTLNPEQSAVLAFIGDRIRRDRDGSLSAGEIADALEYDEIRVVRAVEALDAFGLVRTKPDADNVRKPARVVGLTGAGERKSGPQRPRSTGGGGAW